jgi:hypothetical protein
MKLPETAVKLEKSLSEETYVPRYIIGTRRQLISCSLVGGCTQETWPYGIRMEQSKSLIARKISLSVVSSATYTLAKCLILTRFRSGGENISSVAVESILLKHPAVLEVAVIGVPNEQWGETPKAFVTRVPGDMTLGPEIVRWARESPEMSRVMVPHEVEIFEVHPKTSTGKIQKRLLREYELKRRKRLQHL